MKFKTLLETLLEIYCILKVNQTKSNRMFFYLAIRMTFSLKTEPNRTANTPYLSYGICILSLKIEFVFWFL